MVWGRGVGVPYCMSVVRCWVEFLWLGVGGGGLGVPLVYECCKMVGGTPCGLGVDGGGGGPFSV